MSLCWFITRSIFANLSSSGNCRMSSYFVHFHVNAAPSTEAPFSLLILFSYLIRTKSCKPTISMHSITIILRSVLLYWCGDFKAFKFFVAVLRQGALLIWANLLMCPLNRLPAHLKVQLSLSFKCKYIF